MFTLPILTLPSYSPASSSSTGAIILQGPHHSAQKSTTTGVDDFKTSSEKFPSVNVTIFATILPLPSFAESIQSPRSKHQREHIQVCTDATPHRNNFPNWTTSA